MKRIVIIVLLGAFFATSSFAQSDPAQSKSKQGATKDSRDWKPATVAEITYSDDEKIVPRSHMVKRPGCQGGIGCYDRVADEPLHIPLTVILYRFETAEMTYTVRQVIKKNGTPLSVTLHGTNKISLDGMKIHVLDDEGRDVKLAVVEKIAK